MALSFLVRRCADPLENLLPVNRHVRRADETKLHTAATSFQNPDFNGPVNEDFLTRLSAQYEHCDSSLLRLDSVHGVIEPAKTFSDSSDTPLKD
jgi:hypothetical protein